MTEKRTPQVFISHSSADKAWTSEFASALQEKGVHIWYDEWDLRPGDKWQERQQQALRESRIFCVVVGASVTESPWSYFEIGAAVADRKIIVPVLSGDALTTHLPPLLSRYQAIGESTPGEAAASLARLVDLAAGDA